MHRFARRFSLAALGAGFIASPAWADPPVDVIARGETRVVLDGVLREWSGTLSAVDSQSQSSRGAPAWTGPDDAAFGFAVMRDDEALYLAVEVRDDRVVRTRQHRAADDAFVLTVAFPRGRMWTAWELRFQPGEPGSYAGAVRYRGTRAVPGAQIVEAPYRGGPGFTMEARVPFAALPGLRENLASARMRVAYHDCDEEAHPGIESVLSNGGGDLLRPQDLPATTASAGAVAAASVDLVARFRTERNVGTARPVLERRVNLVGAATQERVVVFPRHVVAVGPEVAEGTSYVFLEFSSGEVIAAELRDVTGDARAEVLVTLRTPGPGFDREVLHVYNYDPTGGFQRLFAHDVARVQGEMRLAVRSTWLGTRVTLTLGENRGFSAATWPASTEPGVEAPLTPWGPLRSATYAWSPATRSFGLERSVPNPAAASVSALPQSLGVAVAPAAPAPDVEGALRVFRQREALAPTLRPTHRATADVADDSTPEQVFVFARSLVVVGPRFRGGTGYASVTLPAQEGDEVLDLRAADVTDDGRAEAIVTVRRAVSATVGGAVVPSQRDMVFAYSFESQRAVRVFGAELSRRVGANAIVNTVVLPANGRNGTITFEAQRAQGWTRESYPFRDAPPSGYEALLLPWESPRVTWRWNGSAMVRTP
jgi:hypothetical protein